MIVKSDGTIYFNQPRGKKRLWEREMSFAGVFRIIRTAGWRSPLTSASTLMGSPSPRVEKMLYGAITRRGEHCLEEVKTGTIFRYRKVRAFDVALDGILSNHRVFANLDSPLPGSPDGMRLDIDGPV